MSKTFNSLRLTSLKSVQQSVNHAFFSPSVKSKGEALEEIKKLIDFVNAIEVEQPKVAKPKASKKPSVKKPKASPKKPKASVPSLKPKASEPTKSRIDLIEDKIDKLASVVEAFVQPKVEGTVKPKASKASKKPKSKKKPKASKSSPSERVADRQEIASYGSKKDGKIAKKYSPKVSSVAEGKKAVAEMGATNVARKQSKIDAKAKALSIKILPNESVEDAIRRNKIERQKAAEAALIQEFEASLQTEGQMAMPF